MCAKIVRTTQKCPRAARTAEGVTPQIGAVMHNHSIPLPINSTTKPQTFRYIDPGEPSAFVATTPVNVDAPLAPVILQTEAGVWHWLVVRCPYCGGNHTHGWEQWKHSPDPREFLGGRIAHCTATIEDEHYRENYRGPMGYEYRLIAIEGVPSRPELDTYFPLCKRTRKAPPLRGNRLSRQPMSRELKRDVWSKSDGHCWYCGMVLHRTFSVDHVTPVYDGGTNDIANLVPCCKSCNSTKGNRSRDYLREQLGGGRFWHEREGLS